MRHHATGGRGSGGRTKRRGRGAARGGGSSRLTREDLEAMRQAFGARDRHAYGRPLGLDDDPHRVRQIERAGFALGDRAKARGVPLACAEALLRFLRQHRGGYDSRPGAKPKGEDDGAHHDGDQGRRGVGGDGGRRGLGRRPGRRLLRHGPCGHARGDRLCGRPVRRGRRRRPLRPRRRRHALGGRGADALYGGQGGDTIYSSGDYVDCGTGVDTVRRGADTNLDRFVGCERFVG